LDAFLQHNTWALTALGLLALVLVAWLADRIGQRVLVRIIARLMRASPMQWDDAILARGVVHRLAHVLPAVVMYAGIALVAMLPGGTVVLVRNVAVAYLVLTLALAVSGLLSAINDVYVRRPRAQARPIKGYLQVVNIIVFVLAGVLIIAVL